jgi:DNA-binding response OmpR family regulator
VKVLLVSGQPEVREQLAVTLRSLERVSGEPVEFLHAQDGIGGAKLAWSRHPDVVVADEITGRMGAFALALELKGAQHPFPGSVVILLERPQDAWLAEWAGADAWFVKPFNPFELADAVAASLSRTTEEAV